MEQKFMNITIERNVHKRGSNKIGVLTCIKVSEQLPNGKTKPVRFSCTYEVKNADSGLAAQNRTFRKRFSGRWAA